MEKVLSEWNNAFDAYPTLPFYEKL